MSDCITWHDHLGEVFTFLGASWDVSAAKTILRAKPRPVERVAVSDLEPFLSRRTKRGDGSLSIRAGIVVDAERVESDDEIDLAIPLIAAHTSGDNAIPIDGWHRVARAVARGVADLPIVYLTKSESDLVRC